MFLSCVLLLFCMQRKKKVGFRCSTQGVANSPWDLEKFMRNFNGIISRWIPSFNSTRTWIRIFGFHMKFLLFHQICILMCMYKCTMLTSYHCAPIKTLRCYRCIILIFQIFNCQFCTESSLATWNVFTTMWFFDIWCCFHVSADSTGLKLIISIHQIWPFVCIHARGMVLPFLMNQGSFHFVTFFFIFIADWTYTN